jgi:hypothetical protein
MPRAACWAVLTAWLAGFWAFGLNGRAGSGPGPRPARAPAADGPTALWDDPPPARRVEPEEAGQLAGVARALGPAVLKVGQPRDDGGGLGDSGTAFVISRRHRLLATNAHVASIFHESGGMVAVAADGAGTGTVDVYRVERVWYHPDYFSAQALGSVLGSYPRGGPGRVVSRDVAPDVAVLRLSADGSDLPAEWPLATADDLRGLVGKPVGKLGFPGARPSRDRNSGRNRGGPLPAMFAVGTVSRVGPFAPRWDLARRWHLVDASAPMRGGDSGGPVFLPDGKVVAVSTWARSSAEGARRSLGTAAVRIDALRELLEANGLSVLVPGKADGR